MTQEDAERLEQNCKDQIEDLKKEGVLNLQERTIEMEKMKDKFELQILNLEEMKETLQGEKAKLATEAVFLKEAFLTLQKEKESADNLNKKSNLEKVMLQLKTFEQISLVNLVNKLLITPCVMLNVPVILEDNVCVG